MPEGQRYDRSLRTDHPAVKIAVGGRRLPVLAGRQGWVSKRVARKHHKGPHVVKILAVETSHRTGSVAIAEDGELLAERDLSSAQRNAQSLVPAARDLLAEFDLQPQEVGLLALPAGPGSFTGLRVGVTFAKTFAYVCGAEVLALDTLQVIAEQVAEPGPEPLHVVMDAQRRELFAAAFQFGKPEEYRLRWKRLTATKIVSADQWITHLPSGATVTGPGLRRLQDRLPAGVNVAPEADWPPRAGSVVRVAYHHFLADQRTDPWRLVPNYFRKSAAEEKRDAG